MALDESALCELLDAIRAGGEIDVIVTAVGVMLQALIDAEADEVMGAGLQADRQPHDAPQPAEHFRSRRPRVHGTRVRL